MVDVSIILTSKFEDNTERKTTLEKFAQSAVDVDTLRQNIRQINSKIADPDDTTYNDFVGKWVSDSGANFKEFSAATVEVTNYVEISLTN